MEILLCFHNFVYPCNSLLTFKKRNKAYRAVKCFLRETSKSSNSPSELEIQIYCNHKEIRIFLSCSKMIFNRYISR